jgi:hypothetical protein
MLPSHAYGALPVHDVASHDDLPDLRDTDINDVLSLYCASLIIIQGRACASTPGTYEAELSAMVETSVDTTQTAHHTHYFDTHEKTYVFSPGLYDAEVDAMREEASLALYSQYHQSIHIPSLQHSMRPDLRHIEDEVAHYMSCGWQAHPPARSSSLSRPPGPSTLALAFSASSSAMSFQIG